jgi:hypothetical protein
VRRALLVLVTCALPAAAVGVAACIDGGLVTLAPGADATAAQDTGPAEAAPVDAAPDLMVADVCGPAPWITLGIFVVGLTLDNLDGSPLPGAQFTSPLCPTLTQYSDDAGVILGQVSANTPFYGSLVAAGYVPELAPEIEFDADSTGHKIDMLPTIFEAVLLPTFDASSSTAIVVDFAKLVDDAGACSSLDGVSLSVPGHPEAQVTYFSSGGIPQPVPGATETTTEGIAAITGLAEGQLVTLAATKTGCSILFRHDGLTGRVPLQNGYVSLTQAYVSP